MRLRHLFAVFVIAGALVVQGRAGFAEETNDDLLAGWLAQLRHEASTIAADLEQPRTTVSHGQMLRLGAVSPRVVELADRLHELDYLSAEQVEAAGSIFTEEVETAVKAFQEDYGLFVDGVVGPQSLAALNRSGEEAYRAISYSIRELEQRVERTSQWTHTPLPEVDTKGLNIEVSHKEPQDYIPINTTL